MQFPKSGTCLYSLSPLLLVLVFAIISSIVLNYRITTFAFCCFCCFLRKQRSEFFGLCCLSLGLKTKLIPHKQDPQKACRRNVERTGETNPPGPEDTYVILHGANICSSRIDRECRFYRSRVDVFRAWTISRVVFAPGLLTFKPKMSGFWKSAEICKDAKTTRRFVSIYFHRNWLVRYFFIHIRTGQESILRI